MQATAMSKLARTDHQQYLILEIINDLCSSIIEIEMKYGDGMFWNGTHGCVQCCNGSSPVQV
jgi:hypothetical protein